MIDRVKQRVLGSPKKKREGEMPILQCAWCNKDRQIELTAIHDEVTGRVDTMRGVLTCARCGKKTVFGLRGNVIDFLPGRDIFDQLTSHNPEMARLLFNDATLSFYGAAYLAAVSVARGSLEQALIGKQIKEDRLEKMIEDAYANNMITERELHLAHGSRLIGNDALHKAKIVTPVEAQIALGAVSQIANALFP